MLLLSSFALADDFTDNEDQTIQAVVVLKGPTTVNGTVNGTIFFTQEGSNSTIITGIIQGLDKNALRGIHIHTLGNITEGCNSTGGHYNPIGRLHGGPSDPERHVGDLGNLQSNDSGVAVIDTENDLIQLTGPFSVIGRAVVIHAGTDDLGQADNEGSHTTGNSGARSACGVIGFA